MYCGENEFFLAVPITVLSTQYCKMTLLYCVQNDKYKTRIVNVAEKYH